MLNLNMKKMNIDDFKAIAPNNVKMKTMIEALTTNYVFLSENMSGKMEGINSISTSNLVNPYCILRKQNNDSICSKCFADTQQERYFYSFVHSYRNTELLTESVLEDWQLPTCKTELLRLEAFGDLINDIQLINYCKIAKKNSQCKVALWTKNIWILKRVFIDMGYSKPSNLSIIYSSPFMDKTATIKDDRLLPYIDHIFTVHSKKSGYENINCGSRDCNGCRKCYQRKEADNSFENFYIEELEK